MRTGLLFTIFAFNTLFASVSLGIVGGDVVGNGGDAILCTSLPNNITEVQLFDYFEAKAFLPNSIFDLGPAGGVQQKIDYVLNRLAKISPQRASRYHDFIKSIFKDENFVDSDLVPVDDIHNAVMPENCHMKQLAIHLKPEFDPYGHKVVINKNLYQQLDDNNKAGLFLHEAIYNEILSLSDREDSSGVRYLNAAIAAPTLPSLTDFIEIFKKAGLQQYEYHNIWLEIYSSVRDGGQWNFSFYDNGKPQYGYFFGKDPSSNDFPDSTRPQGANQSLILKSGTEIFIADFDSGRIDFRENGSISAIRSISIQAVLQKIRMIIANVTLDENENIVQTCINLSANDKPVVLQTSQNQTLSLDQTVIVNFDESGRVTSYKAVDTCYQ